MGRGVVGYATDGLRSGAAIAQAAGDTAGGLADRVAAVTVDTAAFGEVDQAGPVVAALVAARDGVATLAGRVARVHADLAERGGAVAGSGDRLTQDTAAAARRPLGGR